MTELIEKLSHFDELSEDEFNEIIMILQVIKKGQSQILTSNENEGNMKS